MNSIRKGALAELTAATWLLEQGFEVFRNVVASGPFDLIAVSPKETIYIDVKTPVQNVLGGVEILQRGFFHKSAEDYIEHNKKILYVYKNQVSWRIGDFIP